MKNTIIQRSLKIRSDFKAIVFKVLMNKILKSVFLVIFLLTVFLIIEKNSVFAEITPKQNSTDVSQIVKNEKTLDLRLLTEKGEFKISIPYSKLLFHVTEKKSTNTKDNTYRLTLKPELSQFYEKIGNFKNQKKTVVVYPVFTQAAYDDYGFYSYYNKNCDTKCLTVRLPHESKLGHHIGANAVVAFGLLNYSFITDIDIDTNPSILKKYDKVILLHNEYVTKKEFVSITNHSNVVYMYPNALYAEVKTDYNKDTLTLVSGHGYPTPDVSNGFNWKFDNSKYEFDLNCTDWKFYQVKNGKMLNCYPSYKILVDSKLLEEITK